MSNVKHMIAVDTGVNKHDQVINTLHEHFKNNLEI